MNNNYGTGTQYPTVNLAVKKSRLKLYDNRSESPTYFLNKGQEFQIELFNPTSFILLAKIKLNGNAISGGGLVIRPGERIFLERFLEENKKFLFDTYQVDNIAAVKKAIKENGDLVVDFYREKFEYDYEKLEQDFFIPCRSDGITNDLHAFNGNSGTAGYGGNSTTDLKGIVSTTSTGGNVTIDGTSGEYTLTGLGSTTNNINYSHDLSNSHDLNSLTIISSDGITTGNFDINLSGTMDMAPAEPKTKSKRRRIQKTSNKKSKSIETGRVTKGSTSNQLLEQVDLDFEWDVFHSVEYKMLPLSQKRYDSKEIKQRYCGECGKKLKPTHKFCPNCGEEQ